MAQPTTFWCGHVQNRHRLLVHVTTLIVIGFVSQFFVRPVAAQDPFVIDEIPIPSRATSFGMAADSDGSVWYTTSPPTVGHVSARGHIIEYAIPTTAERLSGIVVGADGNVWFGEFSNPGGPTPLNRIARMSRTGGDFQEFVVPGSIHGPEYLHNPLYLVLGPDNNIWFTTGEDALGRITTAGEVTLFYLPPGRCPFFGKPSYGSPYGLTAGPDGALWLALQIAHAVARFDLATEQFQIVPTDACNEDSIPTVIATGPDGNLWLTDFNFSHLFRISVSGQVTKFSFPGHPFGIAAVGNDIFVTRFDHQFNMITRLDPWTAAVLNDYRIATPASGPENVAVDSSGNLWFNEQDGYNIGRVSQRPLPCIDAVALRYAQRTLTIHFSLKATAPGVWGTWLAAKQTLTPLWHIAIPAISPGVSFDVRIPEFPSVGKVGIFTALVTKGPAICGDLRIIDTGEP